MRTNKTKNKPREMRQFARFRSVKELELLCKKKKWQIHTDGYMAGSDCVTVDFRIKTLSKDISGVVIFNTFNGRVIGKLSSGEVFSTDNSDHDGRRWFEILLETFFTNDLTPNPFSGIP